MTRKLPIIGLTVLAALAWTAPAWAATLTDLTFVRAQP